MEEVYGSLNWAAYTSISKKRRTAGGETPGGELDSLPSALRGLRSLVPVSTQYMRSTEV